MVHSSALDPGWQFHQFPAPGDNKDSLSFYQQITKLVFNRRFRYALAIGVLFREPLTTCELGRSMRFHTSTTKVLRITKPLDDGYMCACVGRL